MPKAGVQLAYEDYYRNFKVSTSSKFKESGLKKNIFGPISDESLNFVKFSINFCQKTRIEQFSNTPLSLKIKSITLPLTVLTYISIIDEKLIRNTKN